MSSRLGIFSSMGGVKVIFLLGFVPEDDELYELTAEQYQHYYDTAAEDANERFTGEKIYMVLPKDPKKYAEIAVESVFAFKEEEIHTIRRGEEIIENYCQKSGKEFKDFDEKLRYCASLMPSVFTKGTKYECYYKGFQAPTD
jgi:hypothetical protein